MDGNKEKCKCGKSRYRHKSLRYSVPEKGKTKMYRLTKEEPETVDKIKKMIKEYKKNKILFQDIIKISEELQNVLKAKIKNLTINITDIIGKK